VRAPQGKARADGVSFFSYYQPSMAPPAPAGGAAPAVDPGSTPPPKAPPPPAASPERLDFLVRGAGGVPAAFSAPAPVPPMPWIERPDRGFIAGTVVDASGAAIEGRTVRIRRGGWFRRTRKATTDADGWFGMTRLTPGRYTVRLEDARGTALPDRVEVIVIAGSVARAAMTVK
jgi:hypothetical protein